MSDYTPGVRLVRLAYIEGVTDPNLDPDATGEWIDQRTEHRAEFDRFIAQIKAAAWDEGFDAGERDVMEHESDGWDRDCIPNPYREATHE